jgi:hypothetical protein
MSYRTRRVVRDEAAAAAVQSYTIPANKGNPERTVPGLEPTLVAEERKRVLEDGTELFDFFENGKLVYTTWFFRGEPFVKYARK